MLCCSSCERQKAKSKGELLNASRDELQESNSRELSVGKRISSIDSAKPYNEVELH